MQNACSSPRHRPRALELFRTMLEPVCHQPHYLLPPSPCLLVFLLMAQCSSTVCRGSRCSVSRRGEGLPPDSSLPLCWNCSETLFLLPCSQESRLAQTGAVACVETHVGAQSELKLCRNAGQTTLHGAVAYIVQGGGCRGVSKAPPE